MLFSDRNRPVHLGPWPLERLSRTDLLDLVGVPQTEQLSFRRPGAPASIVNAMDEYQACMDAIRDGPVNGVRSEIPADPVERANHLKAFGYFSDATMVGIGTLPDEARIAPFRNPGIERLGETLRTKQTKTLAAGIDLIMADLKDAVEAPERGIGTHERCIVFLYAHPREVREGEPGASWIEGALEHRAALRGAETAVVVASYIRLLGWNAKAHTASSSDVCLNRLAVTAGLARMVDGRLAAPFVDGFGLAAVTTDMALATDRPLAEKQPTLGPRWWLGVGTRHSAFTRDPYERRDYAAGPHPFETLKRVDAPTTFIDEPNVPRVPKRTDMFARAQFGDMGKAVQKGATGGHYVRKSAPSSAQRRMLGAFVLLQDGPPEGEPQRLSPEEASAHIKAASYFLGVDAVGISRCPDWAWYSHDATGAPIDPPHDQAISMIVDQGFETMEGASGDDWISVAQSMRAYLRFSLLGGVIANQIRRLGYSAKAHSVMDGEVLQPPLLLLSGLGEVSRIGEVILNPFLGPRLKSGVVTTDLPLAHDKPIDFGLQRFCEGCNKCARECPSGAITAGPKVMFNGYEIWKSDSQRCATYRITTEGGAMCGRCMKTCPWNLEGLFAERPFRWAAMNLPQAAPVIARLDDMVGRGGLNPVKKWWWDIELREDGAYRPARAPVNRRGLQPELEVRAEDQTLAVYPANLAPHPWPYPFPMDREKGIEAYQTLPSPKGYRAALARGERPAPRYEAAEDSPVLRLEVAEATALSDDITRYRLRDPSGADLPAWTAGAHLDVVVAPEYLRQYSMSGDPADRSLYEIGVLREDAGRGGSALMHRIFREGRRVFASRPVNHFELAEEASITHLYGGGIGVTPMLAFAHRLHALRRRFALHYSVPTRARAAYWEQISEQPWAGSATLHVSDEGTRVDLSALTYESGAHIYACGPESYMAAVVAAAEAAGFPEEARHVEYFALPEEPEYENHPFTLRLAQSGIDVAVAEDEAATDALARAGVAVDVKCSDGLCGVCRCGVLDGAVEHRDYVLSKAQRAREMILCRSRAAEDGGVVIVDL